MMSSGANVPALIGTSGRARAGHVEGESVALLGHLHPDGERLVDHAVAVDLRRALVHTVGNIGDLGAHLAFGAMAHLGDRLVHHLGAVAIDQCGQPHLAGRQRGGLRLDVADALVGNADVGHDDRQDLLVHLALLPELHRRQAKTFLLDLGGAGGKAARHHAADIRPVACVGEPGEDLALVEERLHEAHIHQMRAAQIGIVDDEDVAWIDLAGIVGFHTLDDRPGRKLHGADENRQSQLALRNQRAVDGVVNPVGTIHSLRNHWRKGRANERQVHFVADLDQAVLDDGQGDGVEIGHAENLAQAVPSCAMIAGNSPPFRTDGP
jgi:hypothetical protein